MSDDRELLEKAARAAGIATHWSDWWQCLTYSHPEGGITRWRPLEDDGDAFRLAIQLKMEIYEGAGDGPEAWVGIYLKSSRQKFYCELIGDDRCASFRRAIVRAAAALDQGRDGRVG